MEQGEKYRAGPSDFLAVERTFLAWVRTGLALMALGFVLARFGLFLQEFNVVRPDVRTVSFGYSLWFGTVLILLGVLISLLSLVRYVNMVKVLKAGGESFRDTSTLAVVTAILLAILGLAMSYYLLATRHVPAQNHSSAKETRRRVEYSAAKAALILRVTALASSHALTKNASMGTDLEAPTPQSARACLAQTASTLRNVKQVPCFRKSRKADSSLC
jgi:inner membrane protein YidH